MHAEKQKKLSENLFRDMYKKHTKTYSIFHL